MYKIFFKVLITGFVLSTIISQGYSFVKNAHGTSGIDKQRVVSNHHQKNMRKGSGVTLPFSIQQGSALQALHQHKKGAIHPRSNSSKLDSLQLAFEKNYASSAVPSYDVVQCTVTDSSGNVYVIGNSENIENVDVHWLIKLNSVGVFQWSREIQSLNDENRSVLATDNQGNIYLCAEIGVELGDYLSLRIVKYTPDGMLLWDILTNTDTQYYEFLSEMKCNSQGALIISGKAYVNDDVKFLTLKLSAGGDVLWTVFNESSSSDDEGTHMVLDSAGNIVVTGNCIVTDSAMNEKSALATLKLSSENGNVLWKQYTYDESSNPFPRSGGIAQDSSGNIISAGSIRNDSTDAQIVITKYTTGSELLWTKIYYDPIPASTDICNDVETDGNNNIYLSSYYYNSTGAGIFILKYNPGGELLWSRAYQTEGQQFSSFDIKIIVDRLSNVYCIGKSVIEGIDGYTDYHILKYSGEGTLEWNRQFPVSDYDYSPDVTMDNAGKIIYVFTGYSDSTYDDFWIQKLEPENGNTIWSKAQNNSLHSEDAPSVFHLDNSGNVYIYGGNGIGQEELLKYDNNGNEQWVLHNNSLIPVNMDIDGEGNVFTVGRNKDSLGYYFTTIKYNSSGQRQWLNKYYVEWNYINYPEYAEVKTDQSGNFYICSTEMPSTSKDFFLLKYSSNGTQEWVKHYGYPAANSEDDVVGLDVRNNKIFTTSTTSFSDSLTFHEFITTQCYNSTGEQLWVSHYHPDSAWYEQSAINMQIDHDNNVFVLGHPLTSGLPYSYLILKYDSAGLLKGRILSDSSLPSLMDPQKLLLDAEGNFYVLSSYYDQPTITTFIDKYTSAGNVVWSTALSPQLNLQIISDATIDQDGTCYILCNLYEDSHDKSASIELTKLSTNGEILSVTSYNNDEGDYSLSITLDGNNNIFVLGLNVGYGTQEYYTTSSILLLKYEQSLVPVKERNGIAYSFSLSQNYPNPFNPTTTISFLVETHSYVSLRVYDVLGQEVATLINNEQMEAGEHHIEWNASNFPSGIYFYRLNVNNGAFVQTRKLVLMK